MGGGGVEPDLRSSLKRITLVSNHTDLSSILSTYEYSSFLSEFAPKSKGESRSESEAESRSESEAESGKNPGTTQISVAERPISVKNWGQNLL